MSDAKKGFDDVGMDGAKVPLNLFWYGDKVGSFLLCDDGIEWKGFSEDYYEELFVTREEDGAPQFLVNLHPDNNIFRLIGHGDQNSFISSGIRYLANLSISSDDSDHKNVLKDALHGQLADFKVDHQFSGALNMSFQVESINPEELSEQVSKYWNNRSLSRFSGAEIKLPAKLTTSGELLMPSGDKPFTHFIKFPVSGGQEGWAVNEWMCLELSRKIGLKTAETALLKFDEKFPPALIVERFDVPTVDKQDMDPQYLMQDFCTLAGIDSISTSEQYSGRAAGTMEDIGKTMRLHSSNSQMDMENMLKRTLLSWTLGDNDMHRKNISMLFEHEGKSEGFVKGELAPVYDVTSEVWNQQGEHSVVLPLAGKTKGLKENTFVSLAKSYGIEEGRAREIIRDTVETLAREAVSIANDLPSVAKDCPEGVFNARRIATFAVNTAKRWGYSVPEWEETPLPKGQGGKSLAKTLQGGVYDSKKLYQFGL